MDWMMSMLKSTAPEGPTIPLALLDIDEKTYQYWGEPFYVPRKPLVKILDYARRSQPSLIFLDVEVAHPGHTLGEDQAITDFIANYPVDAPPLILVRTFRQTSAGLPQQRTSFLDPTVQDNPNVFWASTLFKQDDDFSIRRWLLWVRATNAAGDIHAIPSVQLMATVFLKASDEGIATSYLKLQQGLAGLVKKGPAEKGSFSIGGITVVSKSSHLGQRIFYTIPYRTEPKRPIPMVTTTDGDRRFLFLKRSVLPIVQGQSAIDTSWLAGRVAVIGSSYDDSRDIHITPIGEMPGIMILVNAIHSFWLNGEIKPLPILTKLLIEVLLIVLISLAFARFHSFWGMVVSGGVVILAILPVSFLVFRYGLWLDFALPLLAVQLHEMASAFTEVIKEQRDKKKSWG